MKEFFNIIGLVFCFSSILCISQSIYEVSQKWGGASYDDILRNDRESSFSKVLLSIGTLFQIISCII